MPKFYFRYGTVCSGKSLNLLAVYHSYKESGRTPHLIKPKVDTRTPGMIHSRSGLEVKADQEVSPTENIHIPTVDVVLVDEIQFFTEEQILQLEAVSQQVPVIAYGLRTDFQKRLFPSIATLLAVCDEMTELKTVCRKCSHKALFNQKIGSSSSPVDPGYHYIPVCRRCYVNTPQ